jgi:predicted PhzF superfamily epimerase YddE/YHI9
MPEDPVTGSVHCALAPYWAGRLGKSQLHARQLSERGGELWCELAGSRVILKGRAVLTLQGSLEI